MSVGGLLGALKSWGKVEALEQFLEVVGALLGWWCRGEGLRGDGGRAPAKSRQPSPGGLPWASDH